MFDIQEIRLARALGRAIEQELQKGTQLPDEVLKAYQELNKFWQEQIARELS